jgi:hypothetical protein
LHSFVSVVVNPQADKPAPRRVKFNCNGRWFASLGKMSRPSNWQRFRTLCQIHLSILPLKCGLGELCTAAATLLREVGYLLCQQRSW